MPSAHPAKLLGSPALQVGEGSSERLSPFSGSPSYFSGPGFGRAVSLACDRLLGVAPSPSVDCQCRSRVLTPGRQAVGAQPR